MVDKELIEIWRNALKPSISLWLLNTNYEEMGVQDKEEFERDFDEILDLALIGLKYKTQLSQEGATKDATSDTISRQAAIDALNTGFWGVEWDKALATAILKDLPPAQPEQRWIPYSKQLPRQGQEVICQCRANMIKVLKLNAYGDWYQDAEHCYMGGFVIAWMSLPELYKEGETT